MNGTLTVECSIHVARRGHGRKELRSGDDAPVRPVAVARVPRVSRLMALAIHLDQLVASRQVRDYAEIARLGHVSRARVTQIMNLTMLAPDIQEQILFLPLFERGHEPLHIAQLQPIAANVDWVQQRTLWRELAPA